MRDADDSAEDQPSRRQWPLITALLAAALVFTSLGAWQVQRLGWKQSLISAVNTRLAAPPVPVPDKAQWSHVTARDDAYRRVTVAGHFLHDKEVLVAASTEQGPGYWVMTPILQADGSTIIVNRGFVSPDQRNVEARQAAQVSGPIILSGLLRLSEAEVWILRANAPDADRWYRRDPLAIGMAKGLPETAPFFIDADASPNPGGWPVGGLTRVHFTNNHLVYALTWFALAAMSLYAIFFVRRSR